MDAVRACAGALKPQRLAPRDSNIFGHLPQLVGRHDMRYGQHSIRLVQSPLAPHRVQAVNARVPSCAIDMRPRSQPPPRALEPLRSLFMQNIAPGAAPPAHRIPRDVAPEPPWRFARNSPSVGDSMACPVVVVSRQHDAMRRVLRRLSLIKQTRKYWLSPFLFFIAKRVSASRA